MPKPRHERGSAENEKKTDVARLDENVEVESTRLRFSTRSTLKFSTEAAARKTG
jgi:hypothetical protein